MSRSLRKSIGKGKKTLFCVGLAAVLAAGIALNGVAASADPVQYDVKIAVSSTHAVGLSGSDLYCWGTNDYDQMPGVDTALTAEPVKVAQEIADATVSQNRTLVVSSAGALTSYGIDPGLGNQEPEEGRLLVSSGVAQVAAADSFAAYINKTGALYTWGQNNSGQLGDGTTDNRLSPVKILDSGVRKVVLGRDFALALTEDGTLLGWGSNSHLQLGNASLGKAVTTPTVVATGVRDMDAGYFHTVYVTNNGVVFACGSNTSGQIGAESAAENLPLTQILTGISTVSAGSYHNLAVASDGTVYAWGDGLSGQLGVQNVSAQSAPLAIPTFRFNQIFADSNATFAVTPAGDILSFGENTNFVLAKDNGSDSPFPVRVLDTSMNWLYGQEYADAPEELYVSVQESAPVEDVTKGMEAVITHALIPADLIEHNDTEDLDHDHDHTEETTTVSAFLSGYGDGTFLPNKSVTRAEFLKMLVTATDDGEPKAEGWGQEDLFTDVDLNAWYAPYVAAGKASGLVQGDDLGLFRPNEPITRADASIMVARALDLDIESAIPSKFSDVPTGSYYAKYVDALTALGILKGDDLGNFNPGKNITRAEAAAVMCRSVGFDPDADAITVLRAANPTSPFSDVDVASWYYAYVLRGVGAAK